MKPVDQTLFGGEVGNCFAACIASMLELELEAVPNFCADHSRDEDGTWAWYEAFIAWLHSRGWTAICLQVPLGQVEPHLAPAYVIASGSAPRGFKHSVIYRHGKLAHDPHPSRDGLLGVDDMLLLLPLEPRRLE